jgi:hypothetical protein
MSPRRGGVVAGCSGDAGLSADLDDMSGIVHWKGASYEDSHPVRRGTHEAGSAGHEACRAAGGIITG